VHPCTRCIPVEQMHANTTITDSVRDRGLEERQNPTLCVYLTVVCPFKPQLPAALKHSSSTLLRLSLTCLLPPALSCIP
jgi:hypothetical protein